MQTIELPAQKREARRTKAALRQLRSQGQVPAVLYGGKDASAPLSVNGKEILGILKAHGTNVIVHLKVGSGAETVLLKDIQRDFISHRILHIDFQRISLTEKIEVNVPIHIKGEAPGVKLSGGILEHILREVRVRCLPTDIPASIDADVGSLQINQGLRVKDLAWVQGVEPLIDPEQLVVNIVAPSELEAAPAAEAVPAAGEPEVIAKGKKPVEGEEAAAAAPAAGAKPGAPAAPAKEAKAPAGKEGK